MMRVVVAAVLVLMLMQFDGAWGTTMGSMVRPTVSEGTTGALVPLGHRNGSSPFVLSQVAATALHWHCDVNNNNCLMRRRAC